jgi:hypothetical protein
MDKAKAFYTDVLGFEATQDTKWGNDNLGVFVVPPGGGTYVVLDFMSEKKSAIIRELSFFQHWMLKQHSWQLNQKASSQTARSCLIHWKVILQRQLS